MGRCIGFLPSIDDNCTTLILGSMPSVKSLEHGQYYAHPQNRFWPMMADFFNNGKLPQTYAEKLAMLRQNHIALWDAINSCVREGSLDSAIQDEKPNNFATFLPRYPKITRICFNGNKSFQCFKKYNKQILQNPKFTFFTLPSTSPANARYRMPMLKEAWQQALADNLSK